MKAPAALAMSIASGREALPGGLNQAAACTLARRSLHPPDVVVARTGQVVEVAQAVLERAAAGRALDGETALVVPVHRPVAPLQLGAGRGELDAAFCARPLSRGRLPAARRRGRDQQRRDGHDSAVCPHWTRSYQPRRAQPGMPKAIRDVDLLRAHAVNSRWYTCGLTILLLGWHPRIQRDPQDIAVGARIHAAAR